jgi:hypothetical protein
LQPLAQDYFDRLRARAIVFPRFGVNAFDNLARKPYRDRLPPAAQFGCSLGDVRDQIGQRRRGFLDSLGDLADGGDAGVHVATGGLQLRSNTRVSPSRTMLCCDGRPVNACSRSWSCASAGSRTGTGTVRVAARAGGVAVSAAAVAFLAIATSRLVGFLVRTSSGEFGVTRRLVQNRTLARFAGRHGASARHRKGVRDGNCRWLALGVDAARGSSVSELSDFVHFSA